MLFTPETRDLNKSNVILSVALPISSFVGAFRRHRSIVAAAAATSAVGGSVAFTLSRAAFGAIKDKAALVKEYGDIAYDSSHAAFGAIKDKAALVNKYGEIAYDSSNKILDGVAKSMTKDGVAVADTQKDGVPLPVDVESTHKDVGQLPADAATATAAFGAAFGVASADAAFDAIKATAALVNKYGEIAYGACPFGNPPPDKYISQERNMRLSKMRNKMRNKILDGVAKFMTKDGVAVADTQKDGVPLPVDVESTHKDVGQLPVDAVNEDCS